MEHSPSRFADFWAVWPRRDAKKDALKAWQQVNGDRHIDAILEALAWQIPLREWDGGRFTPLPATYLRGERWTDEKPVLASEREQQRHAEMVEATRQREAARAAWEARKRA